MTTRHLRKIGYTCAYAPLPLIDAAGFAPYRVLPLGNAPDRAGRLLHDNLCPHVKRILDRALDQDLPNLAGMIFVNSCDAMRRLADAWESARPQDSLFRLDLPVVSDETGVSYFTAQLEGLSDWLAGLSGSAIASSAVIESVGTFNQISNAFARLRKSGPSGRMALTGEALQVGFNRAATSDLSETLRALGRLLENPEPDVDAPSGTPIYLFGNVMPDPQAFRLIEKCGGRVIQDDLCTGGRMFQPLDIDPQTANPLKSMARGILGKPPCARTMDPQHPSRLAEAIVENARATGARGVIGHVAKFCDPYLMRLPLIRDRLQQAGLPFLVLEGDCTLRAMGQQSTRIEAFIEMLG